MAKYAQVVPVMLGQMSRRKLYLVVPLAVICLLVSAAYGAGQGKSFGRIISGATFTFHSLRNQQAQLSLNKDFKDVIYPNRNLFYGILTRRRGS